MIGALSLLLFCGPARADGDSWQERLNRAEQLSEGGERAASVTAAQGILADVEKDVGPESAGIGRILVRLSRVYEAAGDDSQFPEMEKRSSAVKSKDFEVWRELGMLRHSQDKSREAEDALKKALAFKPDDFGAERELATVDQELGRDEDAVKYFEKAIKQNPQDYDLYIRLARSRMRLGRSAQAKEAFAQARKFEGKAADAYIQEGYFHLNLGEPARAKEAFENAIDVDTASPFGYHHMGAYLDLQKKYPEAEKYLRRALEILETNPKTTADDLLHTIHWLGNEIQAQGRFTEAEAIYRKCLEKPSPSDYYVECLRSLGDIYASQGKNAQAEEVFKQAAAVCEEGPACSCQGRALIGLGEFYRNQGRRREALAVADQSGKLCAGPIHNLAILLNLAGLYASLGEVAKSEALYGRILAARGSGPLLGKRFIDTLPLALGRMADLEMAQGRNAEAEDHYRQAIPLWEDSRDWQQEAAMLDGVAAACEKEGKPQAAAEAREKSKSLRTRP